MRGFDAMSARLLFAAGGLVAAGVLTVAWGLGPLLPALRDTLDYTCATSGSYPPVSPVPFEGPNPVGEISWFPIGIRCHYWAGEGLARVTNEIDWLATQVAAVGLALIVLSPAVCLWLYLRETRI